ncbi:hypothetical protein B5P19_15195 [Clavibacter sepedonicus]|uniref:Membrane protein n=1 Tax=Clavibacter sepedonicus TaxID=31964 RepID=B0RJ70_CLASE|nr:hypothetical protein B5P19_15195 [Clavibacter sepedonicus]OQJ50848.1 hypothetical protein B5P20_15530 [Clavibacter sepedonicus]CAQ03260.1 putative membrane protein [Clavibacter sepedonicus]
MIGSRVVRRRHLACALPWLSIALVAVIATGCISSSGITIGLGALHFLIAFGSHEACSRQSSGTAR